jgi:hypothetical protein
MSMYVACLIMKDFITEPYIINSININVSLCKASSETNDVFVHIITIET